MTRKAFENVRKAGLAQRAEELGSCLRASFDPKAGCDGSVDGDLAALLGKLSATPYEIGSRNR